MMSCAATRSADSGRRSLLTRLDGYRRQMCNDELFDEPEHRMRRTLASHIGPHAPLPRVPCGGACGGRNDGCHEIVCKSWCVCSLSRRAPAYAVLHPVHVCVRACSIFYFRTFCGLQPYRPSRSRVHRIRCSAWRPRSGPDSGPGCIRHPRRSALFCDSDCAVQARAHVANLPRGASPVSRRSSPTEGAIHVTPLSRIHQNWLEGPRNRECSRPSYLQPRAPRQNGRVAVVCTVGTW